jgi:hypothetical protein
MSQFSIKDRIILILAKSGIRLFVLSTKLGKQTYSKKAIQTLWKAQSLGVKSHKGYFNFKK